MMLKEITNIIDKLADPLTPFNEISIKFCDSLSKELFQAKDYPDLLSLAFWLRKGNILQMKKQIENETNIVPRGLAFHIPPSNVDTMFVYSWILSLLVGNTNIIRLPTKKTASSSLLFEIVQNQLKKSEEIRKRTYLIAYGHEDEITAEISAHADIRIIWGGDTTVSKIRQIPLKSTAKEIVFADRFSYAAINGKKYQNISSKEKDKLADQLFNDIYWFDQAACSSPRILFWIGDDHSHDFYQRLNGIIEKREYEIPLANILLKKTFLFGKAITSPIKAVNTLSNELTIIELEQIDINCRDHCGNGLLYHALINDLNEMMPFVTKKDQTLTYFGFDQDELYQLAHLLNGKGIDRIVPIGQALAFNPVWDGYDLFHELTKRVIINV